MRPALRLIPLMAIGAAAAFLLAGPLTSLYKTHAVAGRPHPSASPTIDPHASPTSCPASLPMPTAAGISPPVTVGALPFPVWVNAPLGVNVRGAASTSSAIVTTLAQGAQATVDGRTGDASGNSWDHVRVGGQAGFVRADFVTATPLHAASGPGWSLMLPQGYQATGLSGTLTSVSKSGDDVPFLLVQTSTADTLTVQLPSGVRADLAPVQDHVTTIQVWNYTVQEQVARVAVDTCKVQSAWARADQGWPYMTSVFTPTKGRSYQFTFLSPDPNSALVKQVLDSITLS